MFITVAYENRLRCLYRQLCMFRSEKMNKTKRAKHMQMRVFGGLTKKRLKKERDCSKQRLEND